MATLGKYTFAELAQIALLPVATDSGSRALSTSQRFGPFAPGDSLVLASSQPFHVVTGDGTVAATTASPRFAANVYKFSMPDGVAYVAMIDSADGAGFGQAYKG